MSNAFIICSNLSFSWPDDTPVFQHLSFTVGGGRTGLVAPNGAGKSTLLKLIAGEYRPSGGMTAVKGALGYLPQSLPLVGNLTVAEVLGIFRPPQGQQPSLGVVTGLAGGSAYSMLPSVTDAWKDRPALSGEHVRLEPLTAEHAEGLYKAGSDPAIWTWLAVRQPDDVEGMRKIVDKILLDGSRLAWTQVDAKTGEIAGTTSFYQIDATHRILSIGHTWIGKPWQRTPLNSESKLLMLRRAFEELGANRVSLETDIRNEASQRSNERLGAQREGVLRAHRIRPDGTVRDTVVYSVIAEEWPGVSERLTTRLAR